MQNNPRERARFNFLEFSPWTLKVFLKFAILFPLEATLRWQRLPRGASVGWQDVTCSRNRGSWLEPGVREENSEEQGQGEFACARGR